MKKFGKFIRGKAFAGLFSLFSLLSVFYVSNRIGRLSKSFFSYDCSMVILAVLAVFMGYMLVYIRTSGEKKQTRNLYEACSVVLCFLLYLVIFLWVYDIADMLLAIRQDRFYIIPVICSVVLTFYGFIHAKKLFIREYDVCLNLAGKERKIVLLSDIHVGSFVDFDQLNKIVETVNAVSADMILIAGDLFDVEAFEYCDKPKIAEILRRLNPHGKIYAALGNHDPESASGKMQKFYQDADIRLLVDEAAFTEDFLVIGRDDVTTNPGRKNLRDIMGMTKEEKKPCIVIDHNPLGIKEAEEEQADLILCGHTHKGQFFPANVFTRLAYGKQGYYGYFKNGGTQSVVSSGAGYFQMPMRIGSNSEIVVLHIK